MTGPAGPAGPDSQDTRPISVAELLARNGTIGAPPVGGRRRRRRGNSDAVSVAELTGEIPIVRPDDEPDAEAQGADETAAEFQPDESADAPADTEVPAEEMVPDTIDDAIDTEANGTDTDVHHEDTEFAVADEPAHEFDEPPSYLHAMREPLFGGRLEDEFRRDDPGRNGDIARPPSLRVQTTTDEDHEEAHEPSRAPSRMRQIGHGLLIVLQSMLAVAFGAGLFIAFDELWKWNTIVALVLSVLVILGLVIGVRIVRKTEDIASTLIAVAVGALVTLGPLALLQSG
jgi:hypothetical protein